MNYAMNDLCTCSNCTGDSCQCGCQLGAAAPVNDAKRSCRCGETCGSSIQNGCKCNEWTSD